MMHLRKAARCWLNLAAACAVLSFGVAAHGQPSTTSAPVLAQEQAMAFALGDQPIAADQLALGRRFTKAMTLDTRLSATLDVLMASMRQQVLAGLPANAPPARKTLFSAALDEALAGLKADILSKLDTGYSRYFAVSMTPATLTEVTTFYESPLGQKVVRAPTTLTEAENQAVGQYSLDHPAMMDSMAAMVGGAMVSQKIMTREQGAMTQTFKVRLCQSLKKRGAASASCTGMG
jgi:hypothetical protein